MKSRQKFPGTCSIGGFTLIEMVVALVITAVVVGMAALVITKPVDAYFDTSERAERSEAADLVVRRLGDDLKHAVPNSVRISTVGNRAIVEMLTYDAVSFFRGVGELSAPGPWPQAQRELDPSMADTQFSVFGRLDPSAVAPYRFDHFIVINNLGNNSGFDAYNPGNVVMTPVRPRVDVDRDASFEERLTITPGFRFQSAGTAGTRQRAYFVTGAVTYMCNTAANTQTIRRFENYSIGSAIPPTETTARLTAPGVINSLIASNVSACRVQCATPSMRPCLGGLVVEFTINRTTSGGSEPLRIFQQFPLDNAL